MQKKILTLLLFVSVLLFSCKKKESTPETPPSTTGSTPTASTASFSALFSNQLIYSIFGTSTSTLNYGFNNAFVASTDFDNFNYPVGIFLNAGTVSANGVVFKNNFGYYMDTTYNFIPSPPCTWIASGNAIPSFTYTNTDAFSTYSAYTTWTDTISKSGGLTLPLTGIINATEARIYVSVTGATTTAATGTVILSSSSSYNFNASALSSLSTATTAGIQIDFYRNNIQTINGKKMNFRNVTSYIKTVPVKN